MESVVNDIYDDVSVFKHHVDIIQQELASVVNNVQSLIVQSKHVMKALKRICCHLRKCKFNSSPCRNSLRVVCYLDVVWRDLKLLQISMDDIIHEQLHHNEFTLSLRKGSDAIQEYITIFQHVLGKMPFMCPLLEF